MAARIDKRHNCRVICLAIDYRKMEGRIGVRWTLTTYRVCSESERQKNMKLDRGEGVSASILFNKNKSRSIYDSITVFRSLTLILLVVTSDR